MKRIKVLSQSVYSKIAAGEVIERPASIVRELIDNSVDAGATEIMIKVEKGGLTKIIVSDNGSGIEKDDLVLALSMHATSKIENIDDLLQLRSMGFRGEALYSIQTISKMTLTSNTDPQGIKPGAKLMNFGENPNQINPVAHKKGTRIEIEDIFYNLPVRKKFLKSVVTEWNTIKKVLADKALSYLNVAFRVYHNDDAIFFTAGDGDFQKAFFSIYNNENPFDIRCYEKVINSDLSLTLYYSGPDVFFSNRKYENLFVNFRPVNVNFFYPAINNGIRNYISPGRYPLIYLYMDINPELIDVNIHPAKKEIKFSDQNLAFSAIQNTIAEAMSLIVERAIFPSHYLPSGKDPLETEIETNRSVDHSPVIIAHKQLNLYPPKENLYKVVQEKSTDYFNEVVLPEIKSYESQSSVDLKTPRDYTILGVVYDTYIIVEKGGKVLFIDQHAAVEAILFMKKKEKYRLSNDIEKLLIPAVFEIDKWTDITEEKINLLNQNKFLIEIGEGASLTLKELPAILLTRKEYTVAIEIIIDFLEKDGPVQSDHIINDILIEASCKEAIKKGDKLTLLEMAEIVDEYFARDIQNCPHGRPSHFEIGRDYLEKVFQRRK